MSELTIGQASARSGLPAKTIRFYEEIGLVEPAHRRDNGYRDYGVNDVENLRFINRARKLGFPLKDIGNLLTLWHDSNRSSAEVKKLAESHIAALDDRIEEMMTVRRVLQDLSHRCHGDDRPECPIIDDLAAGHIDVE